MKTETTIKGLLYSHPWGEEYAVYMRMTFGSLAELHYFICCDPLTGGVEPTTIVFDNDMLMEYEPTLFHYTYAEGSMEEEELFKELPVYN